MIFPNERETQSNKEEEARMKRSEIEAMKKGDSFKQSTMNNTRQLSDVDAD